MDFDEYYYCYAQRDLEKEIRLKHKQAARERRLQREADRANAIGNFIWDLIVYWSVFYTGCCTLGWIYHRIWG